MTMMSDQKKPGFLDGLTRGLEGKEKPSSDNVEKTKEYLRGRELTAEEKGEVAAWLLGDVLSSGFSAIAQTFGIEDDIHR
jgi:hypothetical protein